MKILEKEPITCCNASDDCRWTESGLFFEDVFKDIMIASLIEWRSRTYGFNGVVVCCDKGCDGLENDRVRNTLPEFVLESCKGCSMRSLVVQVFKFEDL